MQVTPNPTAERGQEVTITGNCGGEAGVTLLVMHV